MTLTASNIEHGFLALLALSLLLECALTILHTHAAERASGTLPPRFEKKLTLAAHRKAADYTADLAQAQLLESFAGAGAALLLTYGQGLTVIAAFMGTLFESSLAAQWGTIAAVMLFLALVELPFGWHLRCRIPQQYGYLRQPEREWIARRAKETLAGWLAELPLIALALVLMEAAGEHWWLVGWLFWCAYLVWRWEVSVAKGVLWGRRAERVADERTREMVRSFLASIGWKMKDLVLMTRPAGWRHSHAVLAGRGRERTVVVFAHAAAKLSREELLALIAHDCGHAKHLHPWLRILLFAAAGWCVFRFAGWGSMNDAFFEGFGFSPYVTLAREGSHAGFVIAVAIAVFPILFYPLRPLVNLFSRQMQYDADAYAAKQAGTAPLIRALVKLHRDYATTLSPSRLYSLFHYRRPHAGMRVEALLAREKRLGSAAAVPAFDASPYLEPGVPAEKQPPVACPAKRARSRARAQGAAPAGRREEADRFPGLPAASPGLPDEEALPPEAWLGEGDAAPAAPAEPGEEAAKEPKEPKVQNASEAPAAQQAAKPTPAVDGGAPAQEECAHRKERAAGRAAADVAAARVPPQPPEEKETTQHG